MGWLGGWTDLSIINHFRLACIFRGNMRRGSAAVLSVQCEGSGPSLSGCAESETRQKCAKRVCVWQKDDRTCTEV